MKFFPIKTSIMNPPKDDLFQVFDKFIFDIKEKDIIFITSKIVAIHQGKCIKTEKINKKDLIKKEKDKWIKSDIVPWRDIYLTIKNNTLIASAWIDESNANWFYILWPENLKKISQEIHNYFCKRFNIKNLWIIITDSATRPLKLWVVGIWIYSYGINPLRDERWKKDIFWRDLKITQINIIDSLTPIAVYLMWEGSEKSWIVIWRDINWVEFSTKYKYEDINIKIKEDLYYPILKNFYENK